MKRPTILLILCVASVAAGFLLFYSPVIELVAAQTRRNRPSSRSNQQAPRGSGAKYSAFLHSSEKHKSLACNACHRIPTSWTAGRSFPDVADFPDHDACVGCHRQQFFTRQAFSAGGPAICTICHLRAGPREEARFVFGEPNAAKQTFKPKRERQFTIEFPHDKHQNVIAALRQRFDVSFVRASFTPPQDNQKATYNNCSICHVTNELLLWVPLSPPAPSLKPFKTMPRSHDACFDCHWKNQEPAGANCAGCHKPAATFVASLSPLRISAKFNHEGGEGEHVLECTTCHINITRASTLRGLTPDVPVTACATCHKDSKKTTYPKITTIEEEISRFKRTGDCTYCHTSDVGKKKAPASHAAAIN